MKLYWSAERDSAARAVTRGFEDMAPDAGQVTATPRGLLVWAQPIPGSQLAEGWATVETEVPDTDAEMAPFRHPHSELPDAICYWVPAALLNAESRRILD